MIKKILLICTVAGAGFSLNAQVSFNVQRAGLENGAGVATNGMPFGFLVDTGGDGFETDSYITWDITTNGQFLSTASGVTNDWFVYGGTQGAAQTPPQTENLGPPIAGAINIVSDIALTNISEGQEFRGIWFPEGNANTGSIYGLAGDGGANMTVPSSGVGVNVRPLAISPLTAGFTVAAVPEPSFYAALFGLSAMLYVARKRRRS
ncbi:MAG: PEP-CTERM sorting domain-containing protein [Verrucomicrobiota bacterium]